MFQTQKKKIGLLAIINSFFLRVSVVIVPTKKSACSQSLIAFSCVFLLLLYQQKYAIYQQNSEKNRKFPTRKYNNLARSQ